MNQISIQLSAATRRQIATLASMWGLPENRHNTAVITRAVAMAETVEMARRNLTDLEFVGFLAELYAPVVEVKKGENK